MDNKTRGLYRFLFVMVVAIGLLGGVLIGLRLKRFTDKRQGGESIDSMKEAMMLIKKDYVDEVDPDALTDDAIQHVLSKLDPHSVYISKEERIAANEALNGSFDGIGIEFNIFRDTLIVITPLSGGPAAKAGLRAGDKIVRIDGDTVAGIQLTNSEVVKRLKGPRNTKVTVGVLRQHKPKLLEFTLTRNKIPQRAVNAFYMIDHEIGYIKISRFSQNTHREFKDALGQLKKEGLRKLILDLQGNPGGYMGQAVKLCDEFLGADKSIVYTKGKNKQYNSNRIATSLGGFENGKLVVLINEGSSSASEIVAGALQDNDRALIVGRRSYGKGLVQSPFSLSDGSELRLTVSRYYTPSGRSIQKPYGKEYHYDDDIDTRYQKGEFFHADSIHFNDSLRYTTLGGRTIYGGGGIMPDRFVPLDTTLNGFAVDALFNSNSIQEYAFQFALKRQKELKKMGIYRFQKEFEITQAMVIELAQIAKRNEVNFTLADWRNGEKNTLDILLKADIARKIWGQNGFYRIFNQDNKTLQVAIETLRDDPDMFTADGSVAVRLPNQ